MVKTRNEKRADIVGEKSESFVGKDYSGLDTQKEQRGGCQEEP